MRLLLLGAGGFIGRHIGAAAESTVGTNVVLHHREVLDLVRASDAELGDLIRTKAPDAIVNAVGATGGSAEYMRRMNTELPERLGELLLRSTPSIRFVHLGSAAEFGPGVPGRSMSEEWITKPMSQYGRSKLAGTEALLRQATKGLDVVVLRVFNPVGAGLPETTVLGRAAAAMQASMNDGTGLIKLGRLNAYRDFVDVRDVADAVVAAASWEHLAGALINISSGQATRVRSAVETLAKVGGFRGEIIEIEMSHQRSGGVDWQQGDVTRAQQLLGWTARRRLAEMMRAAWSPHLAVMSRDVVDQ